MLRGFIILLSGNIAAARGGVSGVALEGNFRQVSCIELVLTSAQLLLRSSTAPPPLLLSSSSAPPQLILSSSTTPPQLLPSSSSTPPRLLVSSSSAPPQLLLSSSSALHPHPPLSQDAVADFDQFNGAVALVLKGFATKTLPKPMPQHHRTTPNGEYAPAPTMLRPCSEHAPYMPQT